MIEAGMNLIKKGQEYFPISLRGKSKEKFGERKFEGKEIAMTTDKNKITTIVCPVELLHVKDGKPEVTQILNLVHTNNIIADGARHLKGFFTIKISDNKEVADQILLLLLNIVEKSQKY